MKDEKNGHRHDAQRLINAIESDSEAIAGLLRACGSSRDFGPEQQRQFEQLLRRRRKLVARLQQLGPHRTGF